MAAPTPSFTSADLLRFGIGLVGAFVSLKFLKEGTKTEKALMVLGGAVLSYVGTGPAVAYLKVANADGLVGFMVGLFGMAIIAKGYEVISAVDAKSLAQSILDRISKK